MTVQLADQELDDWLARYVMGWHRSESCSGFPCWASVTDKRQVLYVIATDQWHPTRDMNQAMMLVEKLVVDGNWQFRFYSHFKNYYCDLWREGHIEDKMFQHHDLIPARAICLAVKEAAESEYTGSH